MVAGRSRAPRRGPSRAPPAPARRGRGRAGRPPASRSRRRPRPRRPPAGTTCLGSAVCARSGATPAPSARASRASRPGPQEPQPRRRLVVAAGQDVRGRGRTGTRPAPRRPRPARRGGRPGAGRAGTRPALWPRRSRPGPWPRPAPAPRAGRGCAADARRTRASNWRLTTSRSPAGRAGPRQAVGHPVGHERAAGPERLEEVLVAPGARTGSARRRPRCGAAAPRPRSAPARSSPRATATGASASSTIAPGITGKRPSTARIRVPRGEISAALRVSRWKAKTSSTGAAISTDRSIDWGARHPPILGSGGRPPQGIRRAPPTRPARVEGERRRAAPSICRSRPSRRPTRGAQPRSRRARVVSAQVLRHVAAGRRLAHRGAPGRPRSRRCGARASFRLAGLPPPTL